MPIEQGQTPAPFLDVEPPPWAARGLAYVIIAMAVLGMAAGLVVRVPETVSGPFSLVPTDGADPVRARRAGVVAEVKVHEGDTVGRGAPMLILRSASLSDRSGDARQLEAQARSDRTRLRIAASQHDTRQRAAQAEERRLRTRISSLSSVLESKERRLTLTRELADSMDAGARSGSVNRVEATRLALEVATLAEEVQVARAELSDAQGDLERLAEDAEAREIEYDETRRTLDESIESAEIRLGIIQGDLSDLTDAGLAVVAPCAGTILRLHVSAPGAVVQEGDILSEIACAGRRLQGEFRVPESGLAHIKAGQPVKLRFDAFPYQRYGVKFGRIRWVGPVSVTARDSGEFRALVDLEETSVRVRGQERPLLAGMGGQADVVVGRRSLVSYAFEPVRALRENLRETPP
ncbi:MAG: HlyD family efflux transporter periplasmic adaptor subunit [Gemmatimonadota bacterium]|nr:HlyD family efflux transporter periplasmic adaptor subunit [Gemmatimonadota bacterium]MDH5283961.1 HlyD family efflux transporter periplasmic adaptor subunit [Gemmatimonadota bacterium]